MVFSLLRPTRTLEPDHLPTSLSVSGLSDIGRVRQRNEDSVALVPESGVAVVADGMGGHPGGDIASQIAAATAARVLQEALDAELPAAELIEALRNAMTECVTRAHEDIRARGAAEPGLDGMGTTLTAMVVHAEETRYVLGHVGDSRAYLYRDGALRQLTRDDTWVQERVERGDIAPEAARRHPFAHLLTQCLGLEEAPDPQILDGTVESGDVYLLCTDGLVGMLDDAEMEEILRGMKTSNGDAGEHTSTIQALLDAANAAGGNDNITAALVSFGP